MAPTTTSTLEDGSESVDTSPVAASGARLEVRAVLESQAVARVEDETPEEPGTDEVAPGGEILHDLDGLPVVVGPAQEGIVFSEAVVTDIVGFGLNLMLRDQAGGDAFNQIAARCFELDPTCPTCELAIVLDDVVLSAPFVNTPTFADIISVTGQFTQAEAEELVDAINSSVN